MRLLGSRAAIAQRMEVGLLLTAVMGPLLVLRPNGPGSPASAEGPRVPAVPSVYAAPITLEATRWVMGTALRIVVVAPPPRAQQALQAAFAQAQRLDSLLSNYQPDSPLSQLNAGAGKPTRVPA
jgi:hypothetical protein